MHVSRWGMAATTCALLCACVGLAAQQRQLTPRAGYVYPAGGRQGSEVDVTVGGQTLFGVSAVHFTGQGVRATVGSYHRPLTQREANMLRDKLDQARNKLSEAGTPASGRGPVAMARLASEAGITEEQIRDLMEFVQSRRDPKRQLNPQIAETVKLKITVEPGAAPGDRELRMVTALGLSNPIRFRVGDLAEMREAEPNDRLADQVPGGGLPVVLNGQVMPGDVDRFVFTARKGERIVAVAAARSLTPYLADAVPGWFQAVLTLRDEMGRELACADHFGADPDPVLSCKAPRDGKYTLEIRDSIYRGREDFVYRVTVGAVSFVTSLYPLGARAGTRAAALVTGWNLPTKAAALDATRVGDGSVACAKVAAARLARAVPFAVGVLPEFREREPNDRSASAHLTVVGTIANGRIDRPGDVDMFRITGRAGERLVIETCARRLGSPLDSVVALRDSAGRLIAANDDWGDPGAALTTHQADSRLEVTLPRSATYFVSVRDAQGHGGPAYAYRLRISRPQPDFELRVVPSSISARAGWSVPVTVHALRRDGFAGDIRLDLEGAPDGFALSGGVIPAGQDRVRLTLSVVPAYSDGPIALRLQGRATVGGREVRRTAVPADDMMQAFAYRHLVPAAEWVVSVSGRGIFALNARPSQEEPVRLPLGGVATVTFTAPNRLAAGRVDLTLSEPPEGVSVQNVVMRRGEIVVTLRADAAKARVGLRGNLIFDAARQAPAGPLASTAARPATRRMPLGTLPAVRFEIVAP